MKSSLVVGDTLTELKKLPSDLFHVGVTSPPYNKQEKNKGWLVKNVVYNKFSDKKNEATYQDEQVEVLNELYRVTKKGGSFFYNHKIRWDRGNMFHPMSWISKTDWVIRQEVVWDRRIAGNIRGWRFWQVDERIYWLTKPGNGNKIGRELESRFAKLTSIWSFVPENKNSHPAPFPVVLPLRAIAATVNSQNGFVVDPYCGSGTTCVAASILNHRYFGIDISDEYIKMTKDRLKNIDRDKKRAEAEMSQWKINKTFEQRKKENKNTGSFSSAQIPIDLEES